MSAERSARGFADLRVHTLPGGHWVHEEQPRLVSDLIIEHLRRADAADEHLTNG